jgi:hypothetical protein
MIMMMVAISLVWDGHLLAANECDFIMDEPSVIGRAVRVLML